MDQFRHKIIEESWSKKGLRDYLLVLRKEDHPFPDPVHRKD